MNGKYRETKQKNRSKFYILLSVAFIIVLIKWGIPLFFNIISGPDVSPQNTGLADNVPPQPPVVSALPEATNSARVVVEGYTEIDANTELMINDVIVGTVKADSAGFFSLSGMLEKGENRLQVIAKDSENNTSQSITHEVILDDKQVELTITTPKEGTEYFGQNSQTIDVKGTVSKTGANVVVNGTYALVDKDGNFNQRILLSSGENNLTVKATDKAGNVTEKTVKVVYNP